MTTRTLVVNAVERFPGLHFRALARATGLAIGQLQHHLHGLVKRQEVIAYSLFSNVRYCTPAVGTQDRILLGVLRLPLCREIITHLLGHEGAHCKQLSRHVRVSPSTFSWYVSRLANTGIVHRQKHGRHKCMHLRDPERVRFVLEHYRDSFAERTLNNFMDTWRPR